MNYISRESVLDTIKWAWQRGLAVNESDIKRIPDEDVKPVKHGKWICASGAAICETQCSYCAGKIMKDTNGAYLKTPHCPHCGAVMDYDYFKEKGTI